MSYRTALPLTGEQLNDFLAKTPSAKVGLIGDLCLDMYWIADMKLSQLSRETPHYPLPIVEERYAPGGAGNVACNLAALRPGMLKVFGVAGRDWRGDLLIKSLESNGISTKNIVRDPELVTNTYIKPLRCGISHVVYEDPRLDFENRTHPGKQTEQALLDALNREAGNLDVLCVSDQMDYGCITDAVRQKLCELGKEGLTVIVDSRSRAGLYKNVICKPNEVEAAKLLGSTVTTPEEASAAVKRLSEITQADAVITLGVQGSMVYAQGECIHCPACPVKPPVDFCGAGDTFLAGLGVFLAAGAELAQAARIATLCSAVTIKKLETTGTATPEELKTAWETYCG